MVTEIFRTDFNNYFFIYLEILFILKNLIR